MIEAKTVHIEELHSQLKDARIMMVDDEPVLMDILEVFLEEKGYSNFVKVDDSRQALDALVDEPPDVLLLDLKMPHVDGFDILEALRGHTLLERMPVIVLTSSSDAETKLRALELGATDFLAKPVDSSELALRLRNTLTVKAYQDQLAFYDALTHLPNRKLFIDRLEWLLKKARRDSQRVALLDISLDRFKEINDSFGPAIGDQVLQEVSARLLASVRDSDVVSRVGSDDLWRQLARLGGDEFSIVLPGVQPGENAAFVAARIQEVLDDKIEIGGEEIYLTSSIGIAIYPEDGEDVDLLIKNAGAAAAYAKQQGQSHTEFYSREINAHSRRRLSMGAALRNAIDKEEFLLHYQPKIDLHTGMVTGGEALLRWDSAEHGRVYPGDFIAVAEDIGLIVPIGEWVMREACRQQAAWRANGLGNLAVSVNVAGPQFKNQNLFDVIRSAVGSAGMDPRRLNIEITESMLMGNAEESVRKLHEIRAEGPTLSIDDFGTGYSSLSYLKRFPIDELKIDRSFIVDVPAAADDRAIVRAIVAMGRSLDLTVVAEGVEYEAQVEFLRSLGCDLIQGFYFSEPLPADQFADFAAAANHGGVGNGDARVKEEASVQLMS